MSLYERICDIMKISDRNKRIKAIEKISLAVVKDGVGELAKSEADELLSRSIVFLNSGCADTLTGLVAIVAFAGPQDSVNTFDSLLHESKIDPKMLRLEAIRYQLMVQNCIIDDGEIPLYYDLVRLFPGDGDAYRRGTCILTNRRIIIFGGHNGPVFHNSTVYRLHYDDLENRQYLESIDYLELDRIESVTSEWSWTKKQIVIQYNTRYVKEKGRTIYGPFFFKTDLPKKVTVEEGVLPIIIRLNNLPLSGAPKDFLRKRQDELIRRINDARCIIT